MNVLVNRHIHFGRSSPKHHDAVYAGVSFELANIFANLLGHVPAILASLYIVAVETLCIVLVEGSLHRNYLHEFVLYGLYVFFLKHFAVDGAFVSVSGVNVPCTEHDVVKVSDRNYVLVGKIFLVGAAAYANLVVLSHRTNRLCKTLACHQYTCHKS